jgi:uncharacterized protein YcfJ
MRTSRAMAGALVLSVATMAVPDAAIAQRFDDRNRIERRIDRKVEKQKTKNTLIGVGIGLLGGALLSGGDPWATAAGAAAGGLVGNTTTDDPRRDWRRRDRDLRWRDDQRRDGWRDDDGRR